jgi:hypothetical protein
MTADCPPRRARVRRTRPRRPGRGLRVSWEPLRASVHPAGCGYRARICTSNEPGHVQNQGCWKTGRATPRGRTRPPIHGVTPTPHLHASTQARNSGRYCRQIRWPPEGNISLPKEYDSTCMVDDQGGRADKSASDHRKEASESLHGVIANFSDFIHHGVTAGGATLDNHPWIKKIVQTAVLGAVVTGIGYTLGFLHWYFFGSVIPMQRDAAVQTFPLPIGATLWILLGLSIGTLMYSWYKIVSLRKRVDKLESK